MIKSFLQVESLTFSGHMSQVTSSYLQNVFVRKSVPRKETLKFTSSRFGEFFLHLRGTWLTHAARRRAMEERKIKDGWILWGITAIHSTAVKDLDLLSEAWAPTLSPGKSVFWSSLLLIAVLNACISSRECIAVCASQGVQSGLTASGFQRETF